MPERELLEAPHRQKERFTRPIIKRLPLNLQLLAWSKPSLVHLFLAQHIYLSLKVLNLLTSLLQTAAMIQAVRKPVKKRCRHTCGSHSHLNSIFVVF